MEFPFYENIKWSGGRGKKGKSDNFWSQEHILTLAVLKWESTDERESINFIYSVDTQWLQDYGARAFKHETSGGDLIDTLIMSSKM